MKGRLKPIGNCFSYGRADIFSVVRPRLTAYTRAFTQQSKDMETGSQTEKTIRWPDLSIIFPKAFPHVAVVELDRPSRLNAVSFDMTASLIRLSKTVNKVKECTSAVRASTETGHDDVADSVEDSIQSARVVVLTGAGEKSFCTGRDLHDSRSHNEEESQRYLQQLQDAVLAVKGMKIPTIAAISGYAFGGGLELSLGCDLRVVKADAVLCFPETGLGIFPGAAGAALLPRLVGSSVAKDLIYTSRRFSGEEAVTLGFANRVVAGSAKETKATALDLAFEISKKGPLAVAAVKTVIDEGIEDNLSFAEHVVLSNRYRFPLNETEDFKEALAAFEAKRQPTFKGK